jgi:hypothetical protein
LAFFFHSRNDFFEGEGGPARHKASTYTQYTTNRKTHTDIYASSGIRTHDLNVWAGADSSCLKPINLYFTTLCIVRQKPAMCSLEWRNC